MVKVTQYPHGTISWIDGVSSQFEDDRAFYQAVFGWDVEMFGEVYCLFKKDGDTISGYGRMPDDMQADGLKSQWVVYITVDDVDAIVSKALELGASIVTPARDTGDAGRTAVIEDPAGLKTGFWQANKMIGAERINEDGALVWNEITVWEAEKALEFYTALLGWESNKLDDYDSGYWMLKNGERNACGILKMTEDWAGIDPHWMNYIHVDDIDSASTKVTDNGGTLVYSTDSESIGKIRLCSAPSGAQFSLLQTKDFDEWV